MKKSINPLNAISPIDGRYQDQTEELSNYSSEFGLIKYRIEIEVKYLLAISKIGVIREINNSEEKNLEQTLSDFDLDEAQKIKEIEEETRHDVKAVEYYLKNKLSNTSLSDVSEFFHFGLTSEDINNLSTRLMLKGALSKVFLQTIESLNNEILSQSKKYKDLPMLARTHGQGAIPTTLGKEFLVFYKRLEKEINILKTYKFTGKLNGAVGNYNALYFAYPNIDWKDFSKNFISSFGLEANLVTTQIAPYEDIIYFFQTIQRINGILLDLNQDMWRYISDGWFEQQNKRGEVGSSTMPQKINPILFENSEGNLVIANSLIDGFVNKLPISRLQRDLSGSTISRNFGMCLAYCLLAYKNSLSGLLRVKANEEKIKQDLNSDWSILSEAVQIYLKKEGIKNGYKIIKEATRGEKIKKEDWSKLLDKLPINSKQKEELAKLTPSNYIGIVN